MHPTTRRQIDAVLTARAASEAHKAQVARQLQEEQAKRTKARVRSLTLSGIIRR